MIHKYYQNRLPLVLACLLLLSAIVTRAQTNNPRPLTSQELVRLVYQLPAHPDKRDEIAEAIRTRGLGFPLTDGLRSIVATKSGNDALLRRTLEEAERRRLNPIAAALPPEAEGLELLEKTRAATLAAAATMPDFLVKQQITRSQAFGSTNNWNIYDRLTIAVSYRANGGEQYKLLAVNGMQPAVEASEGSDYSSKLGGTTSTGEYVSILSELFKPERQGKFRLVDTDLLRKRPTLVYEFEVKQENSAQRILTSGATDASVITAYRGRIWVDRETFRVLRLEDISAEIPRDFPVTAASSVIDYDWVSINEQQHLLPSRAIIQLTAREGPRIRQTRNDILFKGYRKFGSELKIIDIDDKDFAPEEPEKTTPPATPVKSGKP
ncbi:MAG: hypothetical protein ABI596_13150 [Pyrinomonadaceae bacterium]